MILIRLVVSSTNSTISTKKYSKYSAKFRTPLPSPT